MCQPSPPRVGHDPGIAECLVMPLVVVELFVPARIGDQNWVALGSSPRSAGQAKWRTRWFGRCRPVSRSRRCRTCTTFHPDALITDPVQVARSSNAGWVAADQRVGHPFPVDEVVWRRRGRWRPGRWRSVRIRAAHVEAYRKNRWYGCAVIGQPEVPHPGLRQAEHDQPLTPEDAIELMKDLWKAMNNTRIGTVIMVAYAMI